MKILNLKIWLSVLVIGILMAFSTPTLYRARSLDKRVAPSSAPVSPMTLASQFFIAVGSVGAATRGVVELVRLLVSRRNK